ncbi:MAG: bifunctional diguanylate cyclase/phosphodiesterase [Eubacteriales bacterium]|nr:bifunctional diguanylate cyclase/phosphodiesterase [Eubacteriales bacterium]
MKTNSSNLKLHITTYLLLAIASVFSLFAGNLLLQDLFLTCGNIILCYIILCLYKNALIMKRLVLWIVGFFCSDFLWSSLLILRDREYIHNSLAISLFIRFLEVLPSLFLLISAIEIFFAVRNKINLKFFLLNLFGVTAFTIVLVYGSFMYRILPLVDISFFQHLYLHNIIDIIGLILLISVLSSLATAKLNKSFYFIAITIAVFHWLNLLYTLLNTIEISIFFSIFWFFVYSLAPLLLFFSLDTLAQSPDFVLYNRSSEEILEVEALATTKIKSQYFLFGLSFLSLMIGLINFSIFSNLNLILLVYFLASNFYLLSLQNKTNMKRQKELKDELEEKVRQRNIEILKQNIKLQDLANRDLLTSSYNRRYFQDILSTLVEDAKLYAIDILQFNNINQVFGESVGDEVLIHLSNVLHKAFPSQPIFRVDSNEFVILFRGNLQSIDEISKKIFDAVSLPFVSEFYTISLDIGVGVATYDSQSFDEKPETLLTKANFALNEVKSSLILPRVLVFDQKLADKKYRYSLIQSLLDTINFDDEFQMFYQAQYTADGSTLVGVEALIRWFSPKLGFVSPGEFIPIAEESATIIKIVDWTLKKACHQINLWNRQYNMHLKVGINISPKYIERPNFLSDVQRYVSHENLDVNWMDLEITETSIMHLDLSVIDLFKDLSSLGISTSVDDFGTGYSSLSYIKNLKISTLKIAKELVDSLSQDSNDALIINAIIKMAQGLHIKTIAEGVETKEQAQVLRELGCDYIQGYYFGKPLPPEDFVRIHL